MNVVISDWDISLRLLALACHISTGIEFMCIKKMRLKMQKSVYEVKKIICIAACFLSSYVG